LRSVARSACPTSTNRTHLRDYEGAIGPATGCLMKVHTSNYLIQGFTKEVEGCELSALAREKSIPFLDDLGSGTLVDLSRYGLRRERTVQDAIKDGADLVTFSGDKLLGGPQAGFIAGRKDLVRACAKNPFKRAMRLDKVRLAALEATLRLYRDPDRLAERLPTLRMLTATVELLAAVAHRLRPTVQHAVGAMFEVSVAECASQIGSGALPLETIASCGLSMSPKDKKKSGRLLTALSQTLRSLPIPVIGRIADDAMIFDLRTLDDEAVFAQQIAGMTFHFEEVAS
jgi:L-seryl-tRNA(Ser) seleniumtransferase